MPLLPLVLAGSFSWLVWRNGIAQPETVNIRCNDARFTIAPKNYNLGFFSVISWVPEFASPEALQFYLRPVNLKPTYVNILPGCRHFHKTQ